MDVLEKPACRDHAVIPATGYYIIFLALPFQFLFQALVVPAVCLD